MPMAQPTQPDPLASDDLGPLADLVPASGVYRRSSGNDSDLGPLAGLRPGGSRAPLDLPDIDLTEGAREKGVPMFDLPDIDLRSDLPDPIGGAVRTTPSATRADPFAGLYDKDPPLGSGKSRGAGTQPGNAPAQDTTNYAEMGWSPVINSAIGNFGASARKAGSELYHAVTNPTETAGAFADIGKGLYSKAQGAVGVEQDPEEKARTEAVADALSKHYSDAYGSMGGFKKAVANDPFATGMDIATAGSLGGGVLGAAPGIVGKAGRIISATSSAIDPIQNALRLAKLPVAAVSRTVKGVVPHLQSAGTGAPASALRLAMDAGATNDPALKAAFLRGMRGGETSEGLVDSVNDAIRSIADERSAAYVAGKAKIGQSGGAPASAPLDWAPINKAFADASAKIVQTDPATGATRIIYPDAYQTLQTIGTEIARSQAAPAGSMFHTLEGFDGLKKMIGGLQKGYGTSVRRQRL